ncbi:hypothetical protein PAMP_006144 [Pampus punctatissimus]
MEGLAVPPAGSDITALIMMMDSSSGLPWITILNCDIKCLLVEGFLQKNESLLRVGGNLKLRRHLMNAELLHVFSFKHDSEGKLKKRSKLEVLSLFLLPLTSPLFFSCFLFPSHPSAFNSSPPAVQSFFLLSSALHSPCLLCPPSSL